MRIDCRIGPNGTPILFLVDNPARIGYVLCYAHWGQHSEASRGYMRKCRKPETEADFKACCTLVIEWCRL